MSRGFSIGDKVRCISSGVIGYVVKEAHKALKDIASLLGFEVLVLRDRKTGRVYRWKQ